MKNESEKIPFISGNPLVISHWKEFEQKFQLSFEYLNEIDASSILKSPIIYLDVTKNFHLWRSFRKLTISKKTLPIIIAHKKDIGTKQLQNILLANENFQILFFPFGEEAIENHLAYVKNVILSSIQAYPEGTITYQILARFNDVLDLIISQSPENINYDIIKNTTISILKEILNYKHVLIGRKDGTSFIVKSLDELLQEEFPLEEILQVDEFLQLINYKSPVLLNNLTVKDKFYKIFLRKLDEHSKHSLLIPGRSLEGETIYWILIKDKNIPISSFEFYISHFIIKSFLVAYMFIRGLEVDMFKWDRYQTIKKDLNIYRNIFDAFKFGLFVVDYQFQIKFANKAACVILEKSLNDLEGKSLSSAFSKESFELIEQNLKINENEYRGEFEIIVQGENKKSIGFSFYPRVQIEDEEYLLLIFKDISEMKVLEEESLRNDRLATLGIIASEIAHEIRNPLAGIRAIAETLKDEMEEHPTIAEYTDRIIRQSERMEALIKNLFTYTKPPRPNLSLCDLNDLIEDVLILFKDKIKKKNILTSVDIEPKAKMVYADSNQMHQVLINIIQNSIDAIEENGKIDIQAFLIEKVPPKVKPLLQVWESERIVKIIIRDNGSGIPEDIQSKLFLPFFTTKEEGVGLGLSIVYQIIKEHNGYIHFESEPGEGTECHIYLPQFKGFNNGGKR